MTKQYTAPKLVKVGSFEEITKSTLNGSHFDAAFAGHQLPGGILS